MKSGPAFGMVALNTAVTLTGSFFLFDANLWPVALTLALYAIISFSGLILWSEQPERLLRPHLIMAGVSSLLTGAACFAVLFLGWNGNIALSVLGLMILATVEYILLNIGLGAPRQEPDPRQQLHTNL